MRFLFCAKASHQDTHLCGILFDEPASSSRGNKSSLLDLLFLMEYGMIMWYGLDKYALIWRGIDLKKYTVRQVRNLDFFKQLKTIRTVTLAVDFVLIVILVLSKSWLLKGILLGALVEKTGCVSWEGLESGLRKVVPARKADMIGLNLEALAAGKACVAG